MNDETDQFVPSADGRDDIGRFTPGCPPGPGRPRSTSPMARLRQKMLESITEADVAACITTLREIIADSKAKPTDRLSAIREMLDRAVGKPSPGDLSELAEEVETILSNRQGDDQ